MWQFMVRLIENTVIAIYVFSLLDSGIYLFWLFDYADPKYNLPFSRPSLNKLSERRFLLWNLLFNRFTEIFLPPLVTLWQPKSALKPDKQKFWWCFLYRFCLLKAHPSLDLRRDNFEQLKALWKRWKFFWFHIKSSFHPQDI